MARRDARRTARQALPAAPNHRSSAGAGGGRGALDLEDHLVVLDHAELVARHPLDRAQIGPEAVHVAAQLEVLAPECGDPRLLRADPLPRAGARRWRPFSPSTR